MGATLSLFEAVALTLTISHKGRGNLAIALLKPPPSV